MGKTITNILPIHIKVYDVLLAKDIPPLRPTELYFFITNNVRLHNGDNISKKIHDYLISLGLPETIADKMINNLSYHNRLTIQDSKELVKDLVNIGLLKREKYKYHLIRK